MNRRTRRTIWIVAAVLVVLGAAIFLRYVAPPEAARLLPESDGILYFNVKTVRSFAHFKDLKPPQHAQDYQQFIEAIGIDPEQDVDEAAIALHRMADPSGPNGPVAYSMVLVGKITGARLNGWLEAHAASRESYAGHTIYSIPSEGRTVRVAQIGYDMVAVSNFPTTEMIHSMLDRHATAALPIAGSTLLKRHWNYLFLPTPRPTVPLLSRRLAWGVGQIGLPFSDGCDATTGEQSPTPQGSVGSVLGLPVPNNCTISVLGLSLPLKADSTIVASAAPTLEGQLRLRIEEETPSEEAAARQAAALNLLVTLARGFTVPLAGNNDNNSLKELLKTAAVSQKHDRVVVTATVGRSLFSDAAAGENALPKTF
jgi:hypothetical protein